MEKFDDIEKVLSNTPLPKVIEGPHRLYLRQSLINQMQKDKTPMRTWRKSLAWVCCLLLVAAIGGWTAQKVYKSFVVCEEVLMEEEFTNPDGSTGYYIQKSSVSIGSKDPSYTEEKAQKHYSEIQALINEGKYEFLGVEELDSGEKIYSYKFILSDGEEVAWARKYPLDYKGEKGTSYQEIENLIASGNGKLVDVHETDTGDKVYIYKIIRSDGTSFTYGTDKPFEK